MTKKNVLVKISNKNLDIEDLVTLDRISRLARIECTDLTTSVELEDITNDEITSLTKILNGTDFRIYITEELKNE